MLLGRHRRSRGASSGHSRYGRARPPGRVAHARPPRRSRPLRGPSGLAQFNHVPQQRRRLDKPCVRLCIYGSAAIVVPGANQLQRRHQRLRRWDQHTRTAYEQTSSLSSSSTASGTTTIRLNAIHQQQKRQHHHQSSTTSLSNHQNTHDRHHKSCTIVIIINHYQQ